MFPLPYGPSLNGLLYVLFGLEIAFLASGLALGTLNEEKSCRLPRPLRMTLSAVLVLSALVEWRAGSTGTAVQDFATRIFLGMAAGFVGDLIMARVIPTPSRLVFGMAAFGVGHCFYLAALLGLYYQSHFSTGWPQLAPWTGILGLCAWAWYAKVRRPSGSKGLNAASLVYGLLIGAVAGFALALASHDRHYLGLAGGALLFLTSDFVLGNWVIRGHLWTSVNDVIWATYVSGQLLIVYSVAAALNAWR